MYLIASLESSIPFSPAVSRLVLFLIMSVCMTGVEYVTGLYLLKVNHIRLWDYSEQKWNIQGIICPKFSLAWTVLGAVYYFLIHPRILLALAWLSRNLAFSFVIGMFYGVFLVDVVISSRLMGHLRAFAVENRVVVRYELLKEEIRRYREKTLQRYHFFMPFQTDRALREHLEELRNRFEEFRPRKG